MENTELTYEQALITLGQGISHDSLKLSQKEHIMLMKSYEKLKELVEKEKNDATANQG